MKNCVNTPWTIKHQNNHHWDPEIEPQERAPKYAAFQTCKTNHFLTGMEVIYNLPRISNNLLFQDRNNFSILFQFPPKTFQIPLDSLMVYKGSESNIDHYSCFWDNKKKVRSMLPVCSQFTRKNYWFFCQICLSTPLNCGRLCWAEIWLMSTYVVLLQMCVWVGRQTTLIFYILHTWNLFRTLHVVCIKRSLY